MTDLLGGQIDVMFLPIHVALPHVKAGKLVALGIGSDKRHPLLPEVPTLAEAEGRQGERGHVVRHLRAAGHARRSWSRG